MKKYINGKVYDTEKAHEIGCYWNTNNSMDLYWFSETLYRKRTGEYFLFGSGNAASRYSEMTGNNSWSGSSKIIPLEYVKAKEWAENRLSTEDYEKEFGEIVDDETSETITISVPANVAAKLRRTAQEKGISLSAYISSLA